MEPAAASRSARSAFDSLRGIAGLLPACLAAGLLLVTLTAGAADTRDFVADKPTSGEGIDAVLVIDSSGSMKETDPKRMRVPAAKMFISLLGDEDRVGLISFSDDGYPVVHLTPASQANQKQLFSGVEKVSALGAYTNLHAALAKGRQMLDEESEPGRRRMLLLMSDGKMDTGDYDQDQNLIASIEKDMVDEMRNDGIEVYTIAFTEASDMSLMRQIASGTGAISRLASNDRELHGVFSTIFESAKEPDMLPIDGGEFVVDDAIDEVTVVASRNAPGSEIQLVMPDKRVITPDVAGRAVRWFQSDQFDMITINKPPAGTWKLVSDADDNRAYVVTNMSLEGKVGEGDIQAGTNQSASAWLLQDQEVLTTPEILNNTEFSLEITSPSGRTRTLTLQDTGMQGDTAADDGRFARQMQFSEPGSHRIRLIARSETFQREKSLFMDVAAMPAGMTAEPEPMAEQPVSDPAPVAEPEAEPKPEPAMTEPETDPAPAAMEEEIIEPEPEEASGNGPNLVLIIVIFILANVLIGSAIGGFLWWRRRKRSKAGATDESEEDDEVDADAAQAKA